LDAAEVEQRLRVVYAQLAELGYEAVRDMFTDDVEYVNPPNAVEPGIRQGQEGLRAVFDNIEDATKVMNYEIRSVEVRGHKALVTARMLGEGRVSGVPMEATFFHVFTFDPEQDKARRLAWFSEVEEEAARAEFARG